MGVCSASDCCDTSMSDITGGTPRGWTSWNRKSKAGRGNRREGGKGVGGHTGPLSFGSYRNHIQLLQYVLQLCDGIKEHILRKYQPSKAEFESFFFFPWASKSDTNLSPDAGQ